ncbi:hypothetical protein [Bartonella rattimassiliensis]|uniref:Uncharacterized protein n=1 Tax=Bartonella rattimassiliensis 15908 TaxID=1094556 RepID=J1JFV7_9HYPH|nr:hypothetical protein [Bartonella rattimassiliensis]EJF83005.1 hypothetical protein MCY_01526 [Bartonella rattimassiliensis 15908]
MRIILFCSLILLCGYYIGTFVLKETSGFKPVPISAFSKSQVITSEEYDKLYEQYVNEQYHYDLYNKRLEIAKVYVESKEYGVYHVINRDLIVLVPENIKHIHAKIVWCACLADLLQNIYNERFPALSLSTYVQVLRSNYNWKENDFIWAKNLVINSKDPMLKYAQMLFDYEIFSYQILALINEISRAEKLERDKSNKEKNYGARRLREYPKFCNEIGHVYHIMMPDQYR